LGGDDEEGVRDAGVGVRGFAEQTAAVSVEGGRVLVIGRGQPVRLARDDRRHHLPLLHSHTVRRARIRTRENSSQATSAAPLPRVTDVAPPVGGRSWPAANNFSRPLWP